MKSVGPLQRPRGRGEKPENTEKAGEGLRCAQDDGRAVWGKSRSLRQKTSAGRQFLLDAGFENGRWGCQGKSTAARFDEAEPAATNSKATAAPRLHGAGGVRCGTGDGFGADAEDFALIGFDYFEAQAVGFHYLTGARNVAGDTV